MAELAPWRVHALDLPGFGKSDDPPWPPELPRLARHLRLWIEQRVPGPFHLVGQSVGCEISVLLAAELPEQVCSVVLAGPAGLPELDSVWRQLLRAALDAPWEPLRLFPAVLPDYFRCGPSRLLRLLQEQKRCHAEPLLRRLPQPVLVVRGQRDRVVSAERASAVAAAAPHGELVTLPGAHGDHFTHPREFAAAVTAFLRRAECRSGHVEALPGPQPVGRG
jgi:pimeloyl-ACP methyl ester carboxylesterase